MTINPNFRNVVIVLALAGVVYASHTAQVAYGFLTQLISLAFLAALAWIGSRLYREHRVTLHSLGTRHRTMLYGAIGVVALTLSASDRLWATGLGTVAWLFLLAGSAYAVYVVFSSAREY